MGGQGLGAPVLHAYIHHGDVAAGVLQVYTGGEPLQGRVLPPGSVRVIWGHSNK